MSDGKEPRVALRDWLLSSDRLPPKLSASLTLSTLTPHTLTIWRFQGMWRVEYAGKIGRLRERHEIVHRTELTSEGEVEQVADGTRVARTDLSWVDVDGEESGSFDVVAFDGDLPSPPGPGWFESAARRTAVWTEQQAAPEVWETLGQPLAAEAAERSMLRALGSPDLKNLDIRDDTKPSAISRAEVTFWVFEGTHNNKPLRCALSPDGKGWGDPPSSDTPRTEMSESSATTLLIGAGWAVATIAGLLAFVVPGLIAGALGFLHIRHRVQARDRLLSAWRKEQEADITALVDAFLDA